MYIITARPKLGELNALSLIPNKYQTNIIPNFMISNIKEMEKIVNKYSNTLWIDTRNLQNFRDLSYIEQFIKDKEVYNRIKIVYPLSHALTHLINSNQCVRITLQELSNSWNENDLNKLPTNIIIDLGYVSEKSYQVIIPNTIAFINLLNDKNIVISSGSIPKNLGVSQSNDFSQPRYEKLLFQQLSTKTKKTLIYGDYGLISPEQLNSGGPVATVQLKYTQKENYLFVRNGLRKGNYDIKSVAHKLTILPEFNENHCYGEKGIMNISQEIGGPGNSTTWVTYGTNHHIILCIEENL